MNIDKQRLRRLVREGKLGAAEAAQMGQALDRMNRWRGEEDTAPRPRKQSSPAGELKLRFLAGEIDEATFLDETRRTALRMGKLFGWLMLPAFILIAATAGKLPLRLGAEIDSANIAPLFVALLLLLAVIVGASVLSGRLFGWLMYRSSLAPAAERLAALQAEVDLHAEPLEQTQPGQCPTCGAQNKHSAKLLNPMMLHWILNPGLAFNELVLGQRLPREMHCCKECGTSFIDCHTCKTSVDSLDWSPRAQFGQWRGLQCARCGGPIPCLRNALALILELPVRLVISLYRQLPTRLGKSA